MSQWSGPHAIHPPDRATSRRRRSASRLRLCPVTGRAGGSTSRLRATSWNRCRARRPREEPHERRSDRTWAEALSSRSQTRRTGDRARHAAACTTHAPEHRQPRTAPALKNAAARMTTVTCVRPHHHAIHPAIARRINAGFSSQAPGQNRSCQNSPVAAPATSANPGQKTNRCHTAQRASGGAALSPPDAMTCGHRTQKRPPGPLTPEAICSQGAHAEEIRRRRAFQRGRQLRNVSAQASGLGFGHQRLSSSGPTAPRSDPAGRESAPPWQRLISQIDLRREQDGAVRRGTDCR